jgi:hypothetical protein
MTNAPRAIDAVLGGWQFNGIYTLQTGQPLQFSSGLPNNTGIFSPGQRLNSTGRSAKKDGPIVDRLNAAFDTTVFTAPANFTFGNLGRVSPDVRGPHTNTADLSLFKAFRIIEGVSLRVQAEAYSALNHPIWGGPGTTMNNLATFGVITSKNNNNRTGQMALRRMRRAIWPLANAVEGKAADGLIERKAGVAPSQQFNQLRTQCGIRIRVCLTAVHRARLTCEGGPAMLAPQDISIFLNNALKPTHYQAELDSAAPLPESIRDMPDEVCGHLVALDAPAVHDIETAWKRIMIMNATQVLYTFTFDATTQTFVARKR